MTIQNPTPQTITVPDLPDPGPRRFWHAVHNPKSARTPMILELREARNSGEEIKLSFSRLIGQQPTIADSVQIIETAKDILIRAGKVDDFAGILIPKEK